MNLIVDCDNTIGVPGRDADDGLALLYLLGRPDVNIVGLTTCYGNSDIGTVQANTERFLKAIGREDLPLYRGSAKGAARDSDAAAFLADTAAAHAGRGEDLYVLALGSQSNLLGAQERDPEFFKNVKQFVLMGGLTEDLVVAGKPMGELNFASDPEAAHAVLTQGNDVAVLTGTHCLPAFFERDRTTAALKGRSAAADYILEATDYWFDFQYAERGVAGFVNWDTVAAAYLTRPDLFDANPTTISPTVASLRTGRLLGTGAEVTVHLPVLLDPERFMEHVFDSWTQAKIYL